MVLIPPSDIPEWYVSTSCFPKKVVWLFAMVPTIVV